MFGDADEFQESQESGDSSDDEDMMQEEASTVEVRRSERSTKGVRPVKYQANMLTEVKKLELEPRSYYEAVGGPESDQWKAAIADNLTSLMENDTWEEVDLCTISHWKDSIGTYDLKLRLGGDATLEGFSYADWTMG